MLAVALVGLVTLARLHRALSHRSTRALLWAGFAVGLAAIGVDQWPEVQPHAPTLPELPVLLATLEEALEVVAEALVLAALLAPLYLSHSADLFQIAGALTNTAKRDIEPMSARSGIGFFIDGIDRPRHCAADAFQRAAGIDQRRGAGRLHAGV